MTRLKQDVERGLVAGLFKAESDEEESEADDKLTFDQVCHKMEGTLKA